MKIFLKTEDEIGLMRKANSLVAKTLGEIGKLIMPGVTTRQLDELAEEYIRDHGAVPAFKGYPNPFGHPFPASICTSVNDTVVHGIPDSQTVLMDGDIISVDCGVVLDGFCGDSCYTFCVGNVKPEIRMLLKVAKEALWMGIANSVAGRHIGDIGSAVQKHCDSQGYGVVRELTGHGIGRKMHEDPPVPNYGKNGSGVLLKDGMCIAIEPMVTMGDRFVCMMPDRWTIKTRDGKPAAHFEQTVVVRRGKAEVLSSFEEIEQLEGTLY